MKVQHLPKDSHIPALCYHHVIPENAPIKTGFEDHPFSVTITRFEKQMQRLADSGYRPILPEALLQVIKGQRSADEEKKGKPVLITFDDGWQNNYHYAMPVLRAFGFVATIFVIAGRIGEPDYMTLEQVAQLAEEGFGIESHTCNHRPLQPLEDTEVEIELGKSRQILEDVTQKQIEFISYPHGSYSKRVINSCRRVGYKAAFSSDFGYATASSHEFRLPRLMIKKGHSLEYFESVCAGDNLISRKAMLLDFAKKRIMKSMGVTVYNRLYRLRNNLKSD